MVRSTKDSAKFRFIDLFAGIGGLRRGFEPVGGECVFTSEWDSHSVRSYDANFPDGHRVFGDITQISPNEIPDQEVLLEERADEVEGGGGVASLRGGRFA